MFRSLTALSLVLAFSISAHAQLPDEVITPYESYNTAMEAQDYKTALRHGKAAWRAAEKSLGDHKTTGDLAFNYGFLAKSQGKGKDALKALRRAVDLSEMDRENGAETRLERNVELIAAAELVGDSRAVKKYSAAALDFADANNLSESVFTGEILVHRATECSRVANRAAGRIERTSNSSEASRLSVKKDRKANTANIQKRCTRDAMRASEIFSKYPNMARAKYIALAANQTGFGYERESDWHNAALSYQKARLALEDNFGRDNPVVMQMVGRWINARSRLDFNDMLDEAKAAGLCDCWPFDGQDGKARIIKKAKSDFPTNALAIKSSGVVVLKTDVSDGGTPENISVVYSWPEGQYDKYAVSAYEKYKFSPKAENEPEGARKDIVESFSFIIYNEASRETY